VDGAPATRFGADLRRRMEAPADVEATIRDGVRR
jgi:hypothetical protein